jgi:rare lipoprotein A
VSRLARSASLALLLAAGGCHHLETRHEPAPMPTQAENPAVATPESPVAVASRPSDADLRALPDAVPRAEPRSRLGNPAFYEVFGQRYTVLADGRGYLERGIASWYGPDFHGERTSIGERYDMYSMTAAHRTLPLPAYARVTNLHNGHSIVVRINDRGPFKANRIIDLSYAAALKLDMVHDGTTLVEVAALQGEGAAQPAPPPGELYTQAGAFSDAGNAQRLRERLGSAGIANVQLQTDSSRNPPWYRVRIGPIESVAAFDALMSRLKALGIVNAKLVSN